MKGKRFKMNVENNLDKKLVNNYLKDVLDLLRQIRNGEATWFDMNNLRIQYGYESMNLDSLRRNFYMLSRFDEQNWVSEPTESVKSSLESITTDYTNGETISEKTIALLPEEINNQEGLLKAHGFSPDNFILVSAKNSKWNQGSKDGRKTLYSSKIVVKPKINNGVSLSHIEDFFKELQNKPISKISINEINEDIKYNIESSEFLEICLPDLHIGQYSSYDETGDDYNKDIAVERIQAAIDDIIARSKNKQFCRIVLALLGDVLACDNNKYSTSSGTLQNIDGRPYEAFDTALELLIDIITKLNKIAPVEVISVVGNHDELTNYMLTKALETYFHNSGSVSFDITPNPRKSVRYNEVLIGFSHGDMKANATWLQNDFAFDWGMSRFREVHSGHFHHTKTVSSEEAGSGVTIRYLPNIASLSAWENKQGFAKERKCIQSFVWNEETGLSDIWFSTVEEC